jgi:hypothetical protein
MSVISGCAASACGHLVGIGSAHHQRTEPAHLRMQQADRVVVLVVGTEGIGADQLGIAVGLVRGGHDRRSHFVQHDRHAGLRQLPGGFRASEAAADYVNGPFSGYDHRTMFRPSGDERQCTGASEGAAHATDRGICARAGDSWTRGYGGAPAIMPLSRD